MNKITVVLLISLFLVSFGCVTTKYSPTATFVPSASPSIQTNKSNEELINVSLIIDYGNSTESKTIFVENGTTVYDAMRKAVNLSVKTHPTYGVFVEGINGVMQGNGKYWQYYIDGKLAPVGVSNYIINRSLILEWKLEVPKWT